MQKIKDWFKQNQMYLTMFFTMFIAGLSAYLGFKKASKEESKEKRQAEIDLIETKAEKVILEERLADKEKTLHEISSDVDDLLDRK